MPKVKRHSLSMRDYQNLNGNIIPFPTILSHANNFSFIIALTIGCVACIWLLSTNLFKEHTPSTKLILSTIVADLIVSFVADFISIQNEIAGGFRFGQIGCIVSYSFMVAPCCISISSLGVVGWERYQSVCNGNQWSHRKVHLWITGIWICSTFLTCLPFITSNYTTIHLDNTSVHCSVRWFDRTFVSIFMAVLILVMATISFSVATFSYYNVYNTYRILTKNKKANQDNQRIVFYKCVAMTICLVFMWTPYYVKVVYEITTGVAVSPDWSAIGSIFALFCPALNPFIIFYFDNRVRGNMLEVVHYIKGITIKKPSQSPASLLEKGAVNNPSFSVEKGDPLVSNTKHM